jgi:hypothetical protein
MRLCENFKPRVEPSPTLKLVIQATTVSTWTPTRQAPTLEGPPRKACHSPYINNYLFFSSFLSFFIKKKYFHGNMGTYKIGGIPSA